jgi:zinc/manganese transport system substrate-binding protein
MENSMKLYFCILFSLISRLSIAAPIQVVVTFSTLENLVQEIGGNQVNVKSLVRAGDDPHFFEPKSSDIQALRSANIIFANGLGFEPWLDKLIRTSKTTAKVSIVSYKVKSRSLNVDGFESIDPHAWNSPTYLTSYIDSIANRLCAESPLKTSYFTKNASLLRDKILKIKKDFEKRFDKISSDKKIILTTHDAAFYLCEEFGIKPIALLGLSTNTDFKTKDLSEALDKILKYQIKTLFSDDSSHQVVIQKLARKIKLKLSQPLYLDGLSATPEPAGTALKALEHNLIQIEKALLEL